MIDASLCAIVAAVFKVNWRLLQSVARQQVKPPVPAWWNRAAFSKQTVLFVAVIEILYWRLTASYGAIHLIWTANVKHYLENMMTPWGTLFLPRLSQLPRISSLSLLDSFSIFSPACDTRHVFYEGSTRLLCRTRRLRLRKAVTSANQHIQLPPQPTCSTDITLSSTFTDIAWEWATGNVFPS